MRSQVFVLLFFFALIAAVMIQGGDDAYAQPIAEKQYADSQRLAGERSYHARQLSEAMNHYLSGLRISEKNNFNEETCKIYLGIGNLYSSQADYEMGIRFYRKALNLAKSVGNITLQNKALNNLVGASCFAGKPADGQRYYTMLANNRENSPEYHYNLLMGRGIILSNNNCQTLAINSYKCAIAYAHEQKLTGGYEEAARSCLAQLYTEVSKPDSALFYLQQNERVARHTQQHDLLLETLKHEAQILELLGQKHQALTTKEEYLALADSLYNKEEFNNMKNAQFLYEAQKSEKAIHLLTEEKEHREHMIAMQRLWFFTLAVASLILVVFLVIVSRQKRQLKQAYNNLFDRSQSLFAGSIPNECEDSGSDQQPKRVHDGAMLLTDSQRSALLASIRHIMDNTEEFCNSDFSIDKLASLIGSNSRYVSETINESYGKNFRSFLNEYRIKEAMKRLSDADNYGNYTLKAISESVGYKSQANFIAVFTKVTGMKPSVYQKISRERNKLSI